MVTTSRTRRPTSNLLETRLNPHKQNRPLTTYLQKLETKYSIINTSNYSTILIKQALKQAWKNLRNIQQHHICLRENHLEQLAEHYAKTRNSTKLRKIQQLQRYKTIRQIAKKHRWYLKPIKHGMISHLLIPNNSTSPKTIYKPQLIFDHLLK